MYMIAAGDRADFSGGEEAGDRVQAEGGAHGRHVVVGRPRLCPDEGAPAMTRVLFLTGGWPGHRPREVADWAPNPEELYRASEIREILIKALEDLSPILRTVFVLRTLKGSQ